MSHRPDFYVGSPAAESSVSNFCKKTYIQFRDRHQSSHQGNRNKNRGTSAMVSTRVTRFVHMFFHFGLKTDLSPFCCCVRFATRLHCHTRCPYSDTGRGRIRSPDFQQPCRHAQHIVVLATCKDVCCSLLISHMIVLWEIALQKQDSAPALVHSTWVSFRGLLEQHHLSNGSAAPLGAQNTPRQDGVHLAPRACPAHHQLMFSKFARSSFALA